jgi:hypothetical protein
MTLSICHFVLPVACGKLATAPMKRSWQKLNGAAPARSGRYDAQHSAQVVPFRSGNVNADSKWAFAAFSGRVFGRPANTCNPTRLVAADLHSLGQSGRSPVGPDCSLQPRLHPMTSSLRPWNRGRVPMDNPANRAQNIGYSEYNSLIINNLRVYYYWPYCKQAATAPRGSSSSASSSSSLIWLVSIAITGTTTSSVRVGSAQGSRFAALGAASLPALHRSFVFAA